MYVPMCFKDVRGVIVVLKQPSTDIHNRNRWMFATENIWKYFFLSMMYVYRIRYSKQTSIISRQYMKRTTPLQIKNGHTTWRHVICPWYYKQFERSRKEATYFKVSYLFKVKLLMGQAYIIKYWNIWYLAGFDSCNRGSGAVG